MSKELEEGQPEVEDFHAEDVVDETIETSDVEVDASEDGSASAGEGEGGQATPTQGLTAEQIKALVSEVHQQFSPKQEETATDPFDVSKLTPEEFQRKFNVWSMPKDFLSKLRSEDEAAAAEALGEMINGVVRQAVTMAQFNQQATLSPYEQQLQRVSAYYAEQREQQAAQRFNELYPDLASWTPLVDATKEQLAKEIQAGTRRPFSSEEEIFKAIAERTRAIVKKLPGGSKGQNRNTATAKRPSTVATGGQGGAGAGSSAQPSGKVINFWK